MLLFACIGLAIGSFLGVCIDRLPRNESVVKPPSHCESCQHRLVFKDLIPILSYLRLRGRCRYCGCTVSPRSLWVELATGGVFAFLYWWCIVLNPDLGIVAFAVMAFYACLFIVIFVIDLEHQLILNKVIYPGMVVALLLTLIPHPWLADRMVDRLASAALGAGVGFGILLLIALVSRGGMGWGDVKMAALIGLVTGFPLILVALLLAIILGGVVALVLLLFKKRRRKEGIPFGPFLSLAAIATILFGTTMLDWYLGLFRALYHG